VAIATGCHWRRDGVARAHLAPVPIEGPVFTPDDLMAGGGPTGGTVLLYDDDHFYMGSVLAELLVARGCRVVFVTPAPVVAGWADNTLEQGVIQARLMDLGVDLHLSHLPTRIGAGATLACAYTGRTRDVVADAAVLVTARRPDDGLWRDLQARQAAWADQGIRSVRVIGDAAAPGPIAWATYAGRRFAEEVDALDPAVAAGDTPAFRREVTAFAPGGSLLP
jgi:dimethylamine/trimethylamine dehydrogenase